MQINFLDKKVTGKILAMRIVNLKIFIQIEFF